MGLDNENDEESEEGDEVVACIDSWCLISIQILEITFLLFQHV